LGFGVEGLGVTSILASLILFFATLSQFRVQGLGVTSMLASLLFFARLTHWQKFSEVSALEICIFFFFENFHEPSLTHSQKISEVSALVYSLYFVSMEGICFSFFKNLCLTYCSARVYSLYLASRGFFFSFLRIGACPTAVP